MDMSDRRKPFPDRKISETFIEFVAPILGHAPDDATEAQLNKAFRLGFTAWNAVVCADVIDDSTFLDAARALTRDHPGPAAMVESLIARKRSLFAEDQRLIGHWEVHGTGAGFRLHAEARDPWSIDRGSK